MASHSLAIAKASLAACMMRPDPISIPRTEVAHFHALIEAVLEQCSSTNIQLCKDWLVKNVLQSASRTSAVGKYLVTLSGLFKQFPQESRVPTAKGQRLSGRRKQLYILYLLNDLFHHTKFHLESCTTHSVLTGNIQSYIPDLIGSVSAYNTDIYVKHHEKIRSLLDLWDSCDYYKTSFIAKLRETAVDATRHSYHASNDQSNLKIGGDEVTTEEAKKDAPYIMPVAHGDASIPFHDLPVGNMLPHIVPNSAVPINPQLVKPLQFTAGPAEATLVTAVKDFLRNVESMDDICCENEGIATDVDSLGQSLVRDEISGDPLEGDGYYGWSREFCEKMKRRGNKVFDNAGAFRQGRCIERNGGPRKRGRSEFSSSRSRDRSRSSSSESKQSKMARNERGRAASRLNSIPSSVERNTSRSLRRRSRSQSSSLSYSPPPIDLPVQPPQSRDPRLLPPDQAQRPFPPRSQPLFTNVSATQFQQGLQIPPPPPPPPPPNYTGLWPPPPPPNGPNHASHAHPLQSLHPSIESGTMETYGLQLLQQRAYTNFQTPRSWGQQDQQSVLSSSHPHGDRGRVQAPLPHIAESGRGRGFGQAGGWAR